MRKLYYPLALLFVLILSFLAIRFLSGPEDTWICVNNEWVKHGNPNVPKPANPCDVDAKSASIANPASQNCLKSGGKLTIQKNDNDGEYGVCIFDNNKQCEEWAFFRNECPKGGVEITGYDLPEQVFCVISGGQIQANGSECLLADGRVCVNKMLYNGQCNSSQTK